MWKDLVSGEYSVTVKNLEGGYFYANHNHQYIVAKNKLAFHELWQKEVGFSWMYCHKFGALNRSCNVIE